MRLSAAGFLLASCLVLFSTSAWGHPPVADNHNACFIVGWDFVAPSGAPLTTLSGPRSEWAGHVSLSYPDNLCAPPGSGVGPQKGADWWSHAGSCLGVPPGTVIPGAYCGPMTGGTFTCVVREHPLWPNAGFGIVAGVDANGDGYVNQLDNPFYPSLTALVTELLPAGPTATAYSTPTIFGQPFVSGTGAFPAGRIIAYPSDWSGTAGGAMVDVACF